MSELESTLVCKWFDGGCCINDEEFPEGTPTEITGLYCKTCKSYNPNTKETHD